MKLLAFRWFSFGSVVVAGFAFVTGAEAVDREWSGATTGVQDFAVPGNWDPSGVPETGDIAIFTGDNTNGNGIAPGSIFTVRLTTSPTVDNLFWRDGQFEVTLDLNGQALTSNVGNPRIEGAGDGVVLNVIGGSTAFWREFHVGLTAGTKGTLNLSGTGTTISASNSGLSTSVLIGSGGTGVFNMSGGAVYAQTGNRTTTVGSGGASHGTWFLTDSGTSMTTRGHIWIGNYGSADLVIRNGASVSLTGGSNSITFAMQGGASQAVTALITGANSLLNATTTGVDRGITLGGASRNGTLSSAGSTHMTVADQGRIQSNQLIHLWGTAKLTIDNGTAVAGTDVGALSGAEFEFILYHAARDALIQAGGNVNLESNVTLDLKLGTGASFAYGEFVELIQYDGSLGGAAGVFSNYAENDEFTLGAYEFRFTYAGGDGNDTIGLAVIPEPGVAGLVLLGIGAIALRRRHGLS